MDRLESISNKILSVANKIEYGDNKLQLVDAQKDMINLVWSERNHNTMVIDDLKSEVFSLKKELEDIKAVYNIEERRYTCDKGIMHKAIYNQAAYSMITKYRDIVKDKMLIAHMNKSKASVSASNEKGYKLAIREMKKYLKN